MTIQRREISPIVHLDTPAGGIIACPATIVQGWLAADVAGGFERLSLVNANGAVVPLGLIDRADVRAATPGLTSTGFCGWIDIHDVAAGPWCVRFEHDGRTSEVIVPLVADEEDMRAFSAAKARKLTRVRSLLRCPTCRSELHDALPHLRCDNGHEFRATSARYDFLDDDVRRRVGAVPTTNASSHGYDPVLLDLIAKSEGPIVDVGAGLRLDYRDDIVNVEIVPYPTTDVVAASEYLPFADDSFDLVISVAVLEHVRDPFAAARSSSASCAPAAESSRRCRFSSRTTHIRTITTT